MFLDLVRIYYAFLNQRILHIFQRITLPQQIKHDTIELNIDLGLAAAINQSPH